MIHAKSVCPKVIISGMMNMAEQIERQEKVAEELKIAYARMLEFRRQKNSEVVVMRDGKIVRLKP